VIALPADARTHALMYHDAVSGDPDSSGFPGPGPAHYKLPWATFVDHLDRIDAAVSGPPDTVEDILAGRAGPRSWSLTFDDAGTSALAIGEELRRRGWRGHFFVTTGLMGTPGFLAEPGIRELSGMGHIIGSHSVSHPDRMSALERVEIAHEWRASVEALSELIGADIRSASLPGGHYSRHVALAAADAGIEALFTSEPVRKPRSVGCLLIGRVSIRRNTSAADAARTAAGDLRPWLREYAAWNLRKPIKALGGERYEQLRGRLLGTLAERRHA